MDRNRRYKRTGNQTETANTIKWNHREKYKNQNEEHKPLKVEQGEPLTAVSPPRPLRWGARGDGCIRRLTSSSTHWKDRDFAAIRVGIHKRVWSCFGLRSIGKSGFKFWNPDFAIERVIRRQGGFQLRNPNLDFMDFLFTVRLGNPKKDLQNYSREQRSCFC